MSDKIIQLNEGVIKQELGELVRQSVEDTLNALLDECKTRSTRATSLLFSEPLPRDDQSNQRSRKSHPLITKRWLPASTN